MPFSDRARIAIVNTNETELNVSSNLMVQSLDELDPYYGRFHTLFREEYPTERDRLYEWLNITGRGKLVDPLAEEIIAGKFKKGMRSSLSMVNWHPVGRVRDQPISLIRPGDSMK